MDVSTLASCTCLFRTNASTVPVSSVDATSVVPSFCRAAPRARALGFWRSPYGVHHQNSAANSLFVASRNLARVLTCCPCCCDFSPCVAAPGYCRRQRASEGVEQDCRVRTSRAAANTGPVVMLMALSTAPRSANKMRWRCDLLHRESLCLSFSLKFDLMRQRNCPSHGSKIVARSAWYSDAESRNEAFHMQRSIGHAGRFGHVATTMGQLWARNVIIIASAPRACSP